MFDWLDRVQVCGRLILVAHYILATFSFLIFLLLCFVFQSNDMKSYDKGGFNYIDELHKFADTGYQDDTFIKSVLSIVQVGCHNPRELFKSSLIPFHFATR